MTSGYTVKVSGFEDQYRPDWHVQSPVALDCFIKDFPRHVAGLCNHFFACTYVLVHACMVIHLPCMFDQLLITVLRRVNCASHVMSCALSCKCNTHIQLDKRME